MLGNFQELSECFELEGSSGDFKSEGSSGELKSEGSSGDCKSEGASAGVAGGPSPEAGGRARPSGKLRLPVKKYASESNCKSVPESACRTPPLQLSAKDSMLTPNFQSSGQSCCTQS